MGPTPVTSRRRWRRRPRKLTVVVAVVAVVVVALVLWTVHGADEYYAISPGSAPVVSASASCRSSGGGNLSLPGGRACVRLGVPASLVHKSDGSIMMVDVLLGQSTPWQYLLDKLGLLHHVEDGTVLVPNSEILGTTPASQLGCQGDQQMTDAQDAAAVVALQTLGYKVAEDDLGAQVDEVAGSSPAQAGGLHCNDLIVSIDGKPVRTAADLSAVVATLAPGDVAHLEVERAGKDGATQKKELSVKLGTTPAADRSSDPNKAFLGVELETRSSFTYPFALNVNVGAIGGPSAGLALTLGLLDSLSGGKLTGGHRIAATGTMDFQGDVGAVGGVQQKTVAVRRAGAQYFFVPVANLADTKGETGSMKVFAVSSLAQVVKDLESIGGKLPASAHLPTQAQASSGGS